MGEVILASPLVFVMAIVGVALSLMAFALARTPHRERAALAVGFANALLAFAAALVALEGRK